MLIAAFAACDMRRHFPLASAVLSLIMLVALACGRTPRTEPGGDVVEQDSAEFEVVSLGETAFQNLAVWVTSSPRVSVGAAEGEPGEVIGRVSDATLLEDGCLVVGDALAGHLVVYRPDGSVAATLGQEGSGPGEFRDIRRIRASGDTVFVLDPTLQRITSYLRNGRYLNSSHVATPPYSVPYRFSRPWAHGLFAYRARAPQLDAVRSQGLLPDSISLEVWRIRQDTMIRIDSLGSSRAFFTRLSPEEIRNAGSYRENLVLAAPLPAPLYPTVEVAFLPTGVILGSSSEFELRFLDETGATYRLIRSSMRRPLARDIDTDLLLFDAIPWDRTGSEPLYRRLVSVAEVPDSLPHFYEIKTDREGGIWLRMQPSPIGSAQERTFRWIRLSSTGLPHGYYDLPASARVLEFHGDAALVLLRDELDVERVALLPWVRR